MHDEVPEALRRGDHDGDGAVDAAERTGNLAAEEVPGGRVGDPGEFPVQGAVEEEGAAEISRDGEDELTVRDDGQDLVQS